MITTFNWSLTTSKLTSSDDVQCDCNALLDAIFCVIGELQVQAVDVIGSCSQDQVNVFVAGPLLALLETSGLYHRSGVENQHINEVTTKVADVAGIGVYHDLMTLIDSARVVATFKNSGSGTVTLNGSVRVLGIPVVD